MTARDHLRRAVAAIDRRLWPDFPHTLRLECPPTARLAPRYGFGAPPHAGLERLVAAGAERYRDHLGSFAAFADDLAPIPRGVSATEPSWFNTWLPGLDTVSLYSFVRARRPRRYVEVGSGESTKVVHRARRDGALDTTITSIDPEPRADIDALCDTVVRRPLELVDLDTAFGDLRAGDIVFFDGSHRALPNSDCVAFFLDVLPNLPAGVLVGVHDVYLPDDYPDAFLEFWWSEQYVLAALLLGRPEWVEIALPCWWASGRPELASALDGLWARDGLVDVNRRGSAMWLATRQSSSER